VQPVQPAAAVDKTPGPLIREKSRLVQGRAHAYQSNILALQQLLPDKEVIGNALIFLKKSKPDPDQYWSLAEAILKDKSNKSKNIKGLTKGQKQAAIENITWKYLDSVCFDGGDPGPIVALKDRFGQLSERGIDMKALYKGWDSDKVSAFDPDIDIKKIKKSLTG
jgi:hypothetical protein